MGNQPPLTFLGYVPSSLYNSNRFSLEFREYCTSKGGRLSGLGFEGGSGCRQRAEADGV